MKFERWFRINLQLDLQLRSTRKGKLHQRLSILYLPHFNLQAQCDTFRLQSEQVGLQQQKS